MQTWKDIILVLSKGHSQKLSNSFLKSEGVIVHGIHKNQLGLELHLKYGPLHKNQTSHMALRKQKGLNLGFFRLPAWEN